MPRQVEPPPSRSDGLQLAEKPSLRSAIWRFQRFSWAAFCILLLVALAGLTGGGGYFSHRSIEMEDANAHVPRVARWADSEHLRVEVSTGSATEIFLGKAFSDYFSIEQVRPHPEESKVTSSGLHLRFNVAGEGSKTIEFAIRANRPGWTSFDIAINGMTRTIPVLILP
jgi:hypothetical protein